VFAATGRTGAASKLQVDVFRKIDAGAESSGRGGAWLKIGAYGGSHAGNRAGPLSARRASTVLCRWLRALRGAAPSVIRGYVNDDRHVPQLSVVSPTGHAHTDAHGASGKRTPHFEQ